MPRIALNTDLSGAIVDGKAPEWVELIPAGPIVKGRDGRTWTFDATAQAGVLEAFAERAIDIAIDINHALELKAPKGDESPAAAWIDRLEVRDGGALWGRTTWTPRGDAAVTHREYRWLSPVFDYDSASGRIVRLVSAGLVNKPNLRVQALNSESNPEETPMPRSAALVAAITGALGLNAEASDDAVAVAITQLNTTALNSERPSLERFVPRADHDAVLARASNAEQQLADFKAAQHETAVNSEIDAALKAGKITPATADYHRASCADEAGLQRFRAYVTAAPTIGGDHLAPDTPAGDRSTALNAEEQHVARQLGIPFADFKKDAP